MELHLLTDAVYAEELDITADELIDQYVYGKLPAEDVERMEKYFFRAAPRRDKLQVALAIKRYRERRHRARRLLRFYLPIAASLFIVIGLGFGMRSGFFRHADDVDNGLLALQRAFKDGRPLEARISGFEYAPRAEQRGSAGTVDSVQSDRAAALLLNAASEHPTAASHHALGKYYLSVHQFEKAIVQFEEALKDDPANAQLQSDTGAALLELGKAERQREEPGSLEAFAQGIEHLDRALEINPLLAEALFNRALCLQGMTLTGQAREAWQKYLETDSSSKWAEEARRNLQLLEEKKPISQSPPQILQDFLAVYRRKDREQAWMLISQNREVITERLVSRQLANAYVNSSNAGRLTEAEDRLGALSFAGQVEALRASDPYVAHLSRFYSAVRAADRATLAIAQALVSEGLKLCLRAKYGEALGHFRKAAAAFNGVGDSWEGQFTEYLVAYCCYQTDRLSESLSKLDSVVGYCERGGYKWLLAQALSLTANAEAALSEHSKSVARGARALKLSEEISDTYGIQKNLSQLANEYRFLGRFQIALEYLDRALVAGSHAQSPRQEWRNCEITAQTLYALQLYRAAAAFGREALHIGTDEIDDPAVRHVTCVHLGLIYGRLRNYPEALRLARESLQIGESLSHDPSGRNMTAYSTLQIAHLNRLAGRTTEALSDYDQAIAMFERLSADVDRYDAYKGRLLCYLSIGDDGAVRTELPRVLDYYETYRSKIIDEKSRNTFFDAEQGVYDLAIDYEDAKAYDPKQAFEYSETFRARSLLDLLTKGGLVSTTGPEVDVAIPSTTRPLKLSDIQSRIPDQAQIIQYAVLDDRILIWLISNTQFVVAESKIPAGELRAKVISYLQQIGKRPVPVQVEDSHEGLTLYDLLISPIESALDPAKEICIVPDKVLNYLPFAALISPKTNRYLAETYTLLYAPSANVFVSCSAIARKRQEVGQEKLLSVGNPSFDAKAYPDLPDLPAAEREATAVAGIYKTAKLFNSRAALKVKIVDEMRDSDVIHLACHYVVDEHSPLLSKFLLAKSGDARGDGTGDVLQGSDILKQRFNRAPLVVLSACRTGVEHYYGGEGMIGAARAFIAAGSPLVVASQWAVDSDATAELMTNFHRRRSEGLMTAAAIRQAQIDMLRGPKEEFHAPYYWAAFVPIGGYTNF